jgi:hypothetical protein
MIVVSYEDYVYLGTEYDHIRQRNFTNFLITTILCKTLVWGFFQNKTKTRYTCDESCESESCWDYRQNMIHVWSNLWDWDLLRLPPNHDTSVTKFVEICWDYCRNMIHVWSNLWDWDLLRLPPKHDTRVTKLVRVRFVEVTAKTWFTCDQTCDRL